ncbi:glycosyltransferase family 2 protein [Lachnospiraceae bacterium C1.1]|nr:glycosyltransferase family 2 protein [Lachnospiraceae bacterium C1.1]
MQNDLISIIITAYNREKYIRRSIESALNQKNVDIEIVLIDDGSTDSTPEICDEYARKYSNVRAIHEKNSGLSAARNLGLDNVAGEYIVFLDDDDTLTDNSLYKMLKLLKEHNADFVMGNYAEYADDGSFIRAFDIPEKYCNKLLSKREVCELLIFSEKTHVLIVSWGKIFKRKVWDRVRFPDEITKSEDQFVFPKLMERCSRIYLTNDIVYNQTMSKISITRSKASRRSLLHSEGILKVIDYLIRMKYYDIALVKFGIGTRYLLYIRFVLTDEECRKEINRLIRLYRVIALKLIPHVAIMHKFRFILFIFNIPLYHYFQRIYSKRYARKVSEE